MLALSGLREGFARGRDCLHTACPELCRRVYPERFVRRAHVPGSKIPAAKPCVSITCKLTQNTRLQVLYSGHLRKTGGWGSYRLVHTAPHSAEKRPHTPARRSQKRPSPLPATSANLCVLCTSALGFLSICSSLSAVDCRLLAISILSPTYGISVGNSFVSPTYAKTGGYTPVANAGLSRAQSGGAPTFSIFSCPPQLQRRRVP